MFYAFQVSVRPYVVSHAENPPTFPTPNPHVEVFATDSPENGMAELAGGEEDNDNVFNVSICQVSLQTEWKLLININELTQCSKVLNSVIKKCEYKWTDSLLQGSGCSSSTCSVAQASCAQ